MNGSGNAGESTYVDIRKRLAALTDRIAGRLDEHAEESARVAQENRAQ